MNTQELRKTVLHDWHASASAGLREFGGFEMPIQYESILAEHLATRRCAGLFDISHMGRFMVTGADALPFLQQVLTNNVLALSEPGMAQYTFLADEQGGAVDDAYLYRTGTSEYLLVVNAANRDKDWKWLGQFLPRFSSAALADCSEELAMLALQGPKAEVILEDLLAKTGGSGNLPVPLRNAMSRVRIDGFEVLLSRTGYTGEPICFELFPPVGQTVALWERLLECGRRHGAVPVGLGARDTLRLEAGLPLYGHEMGLDPENRAIPIFALLSLARSAVSFVSVKGNYVGKQALQAQYLEVRERLRWRGRTSAAAGKLLVPRYIRRLAILRSDRQNPGIEPVRPGHQVLREGKPVGWITSGTTVPYLQFTGDGLFSIPGEAEGRRAIALGYLDAQLVAGRKDQLVEIDKGGGRLVPALVATTHLRAIPPFARATIHPEKRPTRITLNRGMQLEGRMAELIERALANHWFRQTEAINLIPSEQTPSLLVKLLSSLDPAGRYAEHKQVKAFGPAAPDVYYYQGTGFIAWVEERLQAALREFLDCREVEIRPVSGQMANKTVFAGMVDYLNRFGKGEPERLGPVFNNHLGRGGHLSAQYLGALRHYVKWDPQTDRPAVINFPVQEDNPYRIDVTRARELIERHCPQLIIFGKSMVLHPEPVAEIAALVADWKVRPLILYDMAHVLGLVGPHFQEPFAEGADLVTGSTHKTFFGPQRGLVASNMSAGTFYQPLWEKIADESFPGAVSNHHLGTLLGLLGAAYEMLAFKDAYQRQVLANAKAFARALADNGLSVEGDPAVGYTETHQVILAVDRGQGPEMAGRLEENGAIVNNQALPRDASFAEASGLRLGVQELTRFGMEEDHFGELAGYLADIVLRNQPARKPLRAFRQRFRAMRFCLPPAQAAEWTAKLFDGLRSGR